jgi:hypothetical protein
LRCEAYIRIYLSVIGVTLAIFKFCQYLSYENYISLVHCLIVALSQKNQASDEKVKICSSSGIVSFLSSTVPPEMEMFGRCKGCGD